MRLLTIAATLILVYVMALMCVGLATAASPGGTPKLQTGKIYDAVYGCTRQIVVTSEGAQGVDACYAEAWAILEQGKDGWYRVGDLKSQQEWYVNLNRLNAIREHVDKQPAATPADVDPGPRIQAELDYCGSAIEDGGVGRLLPCESNR